MTTVLVLRFGEDVKTNAIALPVFIKKIATIFQGLFKGHITLSKATN